METNTLKLTMKSEVDDCQSDFLRRLNKNVMIDSQAEVSFSSTASGLETSVVVTYSSNTGNTLIACTYMIGGGGGV